MSVSQQRLLARLALLAFVIFCGTWLARLNYAEKISTNVLDLIPTAEQSPEVDLVRSFASDVQSRVMLFALRDPASPGAPPMEVATQFAAQLEKSAEFAEAIVMGEATQQDQLGRTIFERRFEWLLPGWLGERHREFENTGKPAHEFAAWLAERVAADLEDFLGQPEASAMQDLVQADPLLMVPRLIEQARLTGSGSSTEHALIWARIEASPLAEAGQKPVFAVVEGALAAARQTLPGLELRWSGVNRFAAASRERIESEIGLLNMLSIGAVLTISTLFVRRIHKIIHLAPIIMLSLAGAWTISTLTFDRLHILVFVIGSLLSGVAVDYGVYIYMQPSLYPDEPYVSKLRRLLKPLLASCLTTTIGFSLLLFSDLPMIQQIGFFVGTGLLCALAVAMLYFAQIHRPYLEGRNYPALSDLTTKLNIRWLPYALFGIAGLVVLVGPGRLGWRDDIRDLDIASPELHVNEAQVRAFFGESGMRSIYLTYGSTVAEARQHLEAFLAHQSRVEPNAATSSLGVLIPTERDWRELPTRLRLLERFPDELRSALERHGFSPSAFAPFFASWTKSSAVHPTKTYDALAASVTSLLKGPLSILSSTNAPPWFATFVDGGAERTLPADLHTVNVKQLQTLNELFTRYRWSALKLSLIGLALVIASVFAIYPFRRGVRIALIPAGSCFFVFGLYGLAGQTLNLFHLLGAFLGVCLSHNYAIFSAENTGVDNAPPVAIRLSGLSTASSFGVLAFSQIPVIHALGLTVSAIVVTALAAVELEPLARRTGDGDRADERGIA